LLVAVPGHVVEMILALFYYIATPTNKVVVVIPGSVVDCCTWSYCLVSGTLPGLVVDVAPGEGNSAMSRQVQVSHPWPRQGDLVKPIAHYLLLYIIYMLKFILPILKILKGRQYRDSLEPNPTQANTVRLSFQPMLVPTAHNIFYVLFHMLDFPKEGF
jgi:hypothetical protein